MLSLLVNKCFRPTEKHKMNYKDKDGQENGQELNKTNIFMENLDLSSDEEDNGLCIDGGYLIDNLI